MAEDYLKVVGTLNRGYTQVRALPDDQTLLTRRSKAKEGYLLNA
jgi:hypothetical protein